MAELRREPVLRLMPSPGDINANGHIFGGWVLSQMDKAGGIIARLRSGGPVADIRDAGLLPTQFERHVVWASTAHEPRSSSRNGPASSRIRPRRGRSKSMIR